MFTVLVLELPEKTQRVSKLLFSSLALPGPELFIFSAPGESWNVGAGSKTGPGVPSLWQPWRFFVDITSFQAAHPPVLDVLLSAGERKDGKSSCPRGTGEDSALCGQSQGMDSNQQRLDLILEAFSSFSVPVMIPVELVVLPGRSHREFRAVASPGQRTGALT